MKYYLYIEDHNGKHELEFDSLKEARSELSTRLSLEYSNGSSMTKQGTDDYAVHNYWEGNTHMYIKKGDEAQNGYKKHITIAVGNWKNYRVFKSKEALIKYIQTIVAGGYKALMTDINPKTQKIQQIPIRHDMDAMYKEVFDMGLTLVKKAADGKESRINIYETPIKK